jgi:hypothetical protein
VKKYKYPFTPSSISLSLSTHFEPQNSELIYSPSLLPLALGCWDLVGIKGGIKG